MSLEMTVVAEALYLTRSLPDAARWPYWLLRRTVVPYVAARQFVVLHRDDMPFVFAGWAMEDPDRPQPWRSDRYLPARGELTGKGSPCLTQILSPFMPKASAVAAVARELGWPELPPWVERAPDGRVVRVHSEEAVRGTDN